MAKVNSPFASQKAHGTFAKQMIFETDKGRQRVKRYKIPRDKKSQAQLLIRALNSSAVAVWKLLTGLEKSYFLMNNENIWNLVNVENTHGYTGFVKKSITY